MEIVSSPIFIFILYITSWLIFSPIILFIEYFSKEQLFIKYITPLFFIKEKKAKYIYHYIDDVINYLKEIKLDYLNKLTEDDYTQKIIGEPFLCRYTKDFLFFLSYSYNDLDYIKSIINKYHSTLVKLTKHYDNPNYLQIKYFDTNSNLFNKEYLLYYVFSHTKSEYKELMNPVFNTLYSNGVHETWKFSPFNGQNYSEDLNYMKELSIFNEKKQIEDYFSNSAGKCSINKRL